MRDDMGSVRVDVELENPIRPGERRTFQAVLVDTGAELSWVPAPVLESLGIERHAQWRFRQADGTILERWVGPAFIHVAGKGATDDVVFGEPGDLALLGSRTLEGLNFRVEPVTTRLVDAGPAPAAAGSQPLGKVCTGNARPLCRDSLGVKAGVRFPGVGSGARAPRCPAASRAPAGSTAGRARDPTTRATGRAP